MPSGITAGDLLIIVFSADGDTNCTIGSGGWTRLDQTKADSGGFFLVTGAIFWKIAAGSDTATVTTSTSEETSHIVYRIDGASEIMSWRYNSGSSTNSAPLDLDQGNVGSEDYLWLVTRSGDNTVQASAAPTGFTDLTTITAANSTGASTAAAEKEEDNGVGNVTISDTFTSAAEQWVCFTLCIAPTRGLMEDLQDTFTTSLGAFWDSSGTVSIASDQLQLQASPSVDYSDVISNYGDGYRNLTASAAFIKLVSLTNSNPDGVEFGFFLTRPNAVTLEVDHIGWILYGNGTNTRIRAVRRLAGTSVLMGTDTLYSGTTHKYLRISESGGTITWSYASQAQFDASSWQTFTTYAVSSLFDVQGVGTEIFLQDYIGAGLTSTALVDDFNVAVETGVAELEADAEMTLGTPEIYMVVTDDTDMAGDATVTALGTVTVVASATMVGDASILAIGRSLVTNEPLENKDVIYKVYDSDGAFIEEWQVITELNLPKQINNLGSTLQLEVAKTPEDRNVSTDPLTTEADEPIETENDITIVNFGTAAQPFGAGSSIQIGNRVEIWLYFGYYDIIELSDGSPLEDHDEVPIDIAIGSPNGRCMFTGELVSYTPRYGNNNTTQVKLNSYSYRFKDYVLENADDTSVPYFSTPPNTILKDIIDKAQLDGLEVDYNETTIESTGTIVSYKYKVNTYQEAIEKVIELAPEDWFWYYDSATNLLWLRARPTQADHTLILGKHIMDFEPTTHLEPVVNTVYFKGGEVTPGVHFFKKYSDPTSVALWGQRLEIMSDERVTLEETADILAMNKINQYKDPTYSGKILITADRYIIEDIQLGHMFDFANFDNYIDDLLLQVSAIEYHTDYLIADVGSLIPSPNKRIKDIKRNLDALTAVSMPDTPDS
jgi:hypothetical protein